MHTSRRGMQVERSTVGPTGTQEPNDNDGRSNDETAHQARDPLQHIPFAAGSRDSPFDHNALPAGSIMQSSLQPPCSPRRPRSPAESAVAVQHLTESIRRATRNVKSSSSASTGTSRKPSRAVTPVSHAETSVSDDSGSIIKASCMTYFSSGGALPNTQGLGSPQPAPIGVPTYPATPVSLSSPLNVPDTSNALPKSTDNDEVRAPPPLPTREAYIASPIPRPPSLSQHPVYRIRSHVPERYRKLPPFPGRPPSCPLPDRPAPKRKITHHVGAVLAARRLCVPSPTIPPTSIQKGDRFEVLANTANSYALVRHLRLGVEVRMPAGVLHQV